MNPGLVIVDKPAGMTSHDVVGRCRRIFGTRRVGHAGTLDPMATGVLVIGIERATKILGLVTETSKSYAATVRLGQSTSTEDAEGDITQQVSARGVTDEAIEAAIAGLRGDIAQIPSAVSAIKVDGQRAYRLVREGHAVELAARPVRIDRFEMLAVRRHDELVDVDVDVDCSSGTYIRALARDVGATLAVGGHLTALRRTRVGRFGLDQARPLDELAERPSLSLTLDEACLQLFPAPTTHRRRGRRGRQRPRVEPGRHRRRLRRAHRRRPGHGIAAGRGKQDEVRRRDPAGQPITTRRTARSGNIP